MNERYQPSSQSCQSCWTGRDDGPTLSASTNASNLSIYATPFPPPNPAKKSIALIGFASDEGIKRNQGRTGAAEGPNALRAALANIPLPENSNSPQLISTTAAISPAPMATSKKRKPH